MTLRRRPPTVVQIFAGPIPPPPASSLVESPVGSHIGTDPRDPGNSLLVTRIVDSSLNIWTVVAGRIYQNGVLDPVTSGVVLLLYYYAPATSSGARFVYQENS